MSNTKKAVSKLPKPPIETAPLSEWAQWNAKIGERTGAFKVFPCRPNEKRPLYQGWQNDASTDPEIVAAMWDKDPEANIGLAIQPHFAVIDGDLYKPGAEQELEAFEAEHGELPCTFESETPSGGIHLIYATEKTFGNGRGTLPDFGDMRGHGGLIVGPGSVFEGKRYKIANLAMPVRMPNHVEGMLRETKRRDRGVPDVPAPFVVVDDPRNVEFFTDWCSGKPRMTITTPNGEVAEPCVEGERGNDRLAATGAMAHDYGVSEDLATEIALEHFNPRCEPPWDDEEFDKHFRSGYQSAGGQLGSRAPKQHYQKMFEPRYEQAATSTGIGELNLGKFRAVSREGIDNITPPQWLIPDTLPANGYATLVGAPGSFKTFVALDMACRICTGIDDGLYGAVQETGSVIFAVGEGRSGHKMRLRAWEKTHFDEKKVDNLVLLDPVPTARGGPSEWQDFIRLVRLICPEGVKLVIVDTIGRSMQGMNENSQQDASQFTAMVDMIQRELGCAVLALHHTGHANGERGKGSMEFIGMPDTALVLTRKAKSKFAALKMTKQKDAEEWTTEKELKFANVQTEHGTTLTVTKLDKGETAKSKNDPRGSVDLQVIDEATLDILASTPGKEWSQRALAGAVARHEGIDISSRQLETQWLTTLREWKEANCFNSYDAVKKRWIFSAAPKRQKRKG